jgi:predicted GNAT family acetyltransferase
LPRCSGVHQPLIRAYIGKGLRKDLAKLEIGRVIDSLRRHGVDEKVIAESVAEARAKSV